MLGGALTVPISLDTPLYTERVTLNGLEYVLKFDWNGRQKRWFLSILDIDENALASGIKIVCDSIMLRRWVGRPGYTKGMLTAMSLFSDAPPTFYEFGRRVQLIYFPFVPDPAKVTSNRV